MKVMLEDRDEGKMHDLREVGVYLFDTDAGRFNDRFVLHINPGILVPQSDNKPVEKTFKLYGYKNKLILNDPHSLAKDVSIYDVSGKLHYHSSLSASIYHAIELNLPDGIYIVKAMTAKGEIVEKVFFGR